jgi:hypothetical protein
MRRILILLLLSGCTATGPVFKEPEYPAVVIYQPAEGLNGLGSLTNPVEINGEKVCDLHHGAYFIARPQGKMIISASWFDRPGTSRIKMDANPKKTYYIHMEWNKWKSSAIGFGMLGALVAEGASDHGGPFIFNLVEPAAAMQELSGLKQDCI